VDLPWSALATTTADIQVAVTCARTGEILHYGLADDVAGAPALVRASMILPGGCGPPVFSKGRPLIDGAPGALPVDAIGARAAVAFALLCWPQGYRSPRTSLLEWLFAPWWSRGIDRRARKAFLDRGQTDVRARDIILGRAPDPRCPTAWIPIAATHERLPGKACRQRAVLAEAIEQGARRFVSAVYGDAPPPQTRAFLKELTAVCRTSQ
jgi:hypothetical protein